MTEAIPWIYQEGNRGVWVIETTCRLNRESELVTVPEKAAFVRGYFDAEGGIPRCAADRFYIQIVQRDRLDLGKVRHLLQELDIRCGRVHNPSIRVDPDCWRFYILASSHEGFIRRVGSWHPRKRPAA